MKLAELPGQGPVVIYTFIQAFTASAAHLRRRLLRVVRMAILIASIQQRANENPFIRAL